MDFLSLITDLVLLCATISWVGRKPSLRRVTAMIFIIVVVYLGFNEYLALQKGMSIFETYRESLVATIDMYKEALTPEQLQAMEPMLAEAPYCLVSLVFIQAATQVLVALFLIWTLRRLTRRPLGWTPVSGIDLPIWTVMPLIAGLLLYAIGNVPAVPYGHAVWLIGVNLLIASVVPLTVQGFAATKGVMNKAGFGPIVQTVVAAVGFVSGIIALILPGVGLVDYWANIRRLPRS